MPSAQEGETLNLHATTVGLGDRGLLILGAAGRGKSELALQLMAYGATLVADDRTLITRRGHALVAFAPETIRGMIEMRGIGILAADALEATTLVLAVDLDRQEQERLPPAREWEALGLRLPLLHGVKSIHFAAGLLQYLRSGRVQEPVRPKLSDR